MYTNVPVADILLKNREGKPISFVEVKSYSHLSPDIKAETIEQLNSYVSQLAEPGTVRYITVLSPATGYIKDLQRGTAITFSTNEIVNQYLPQGAVTIINNYVLTSIFTNWLRDLSLGMRENLTKDEKRLDKFGFINTIKSSATVIEPRT